MILGYIVFCLIFIFLTLTTKMESTSEKKDFEGIGKIKETPIELQVPLEVGGEVLTRLFQETTYTPEELVPNSPEGSDKSMTPIEGGSSALGLFEEKVSEEFLDTMETATRDIEGPQNPRIADIDSHEIPRILQESSDLKSKEEAVDEDKIPAVAVRSESIDDSWKIACESMVQMLENSSIAYNKSEFRALVKASMLFSSFNKRDAIMFLTGMRAKADYLNVELGKTSSIMSKTQKGISSQVDRLSRTASDLSDKAAKILSIASNNIDVKELIKQQFLDEAFLQSVIAGVTDIVQKDLEKTSRSYKIELDDVKKTSDSIKVPSKPRLSQMMSQTRSPDTQVGTPTSNISGFKHEPGQTQTLSQALNIKRKLKLPEAQPTLPILSTVFKQTLSGLKQPQTMFQKESSSSTTVDDSNPSKKFVKNLCILLELPGPFANLLISNYTDSYDLLSHIPETLDEIKYKFGSLQSARQQVSKLARELMLSVRRDKESE
uniref:Protein 2 n=1 Tax=Asplenium virus 1 TaxID=2977956 RepID=A0A9N7AAM2_9RHAB|nr:TPA_asm: protein 2 [Asplenium virus 1]